MDAKQGGKLLLTPDRHEFRWQRSPGKQVSLCELHGNQVQLQVYCCCPDRYNYGCKDVWKHNHDTDLLVKKVYDKEKEAIEEAARNPAASPKTLLGNLSVNDTAKNVNAVSYLRNQAAFEKAVQKELAKLVANVEIFQVLITVIKIYKVILHF